MDLVDYLTQDHKKLRKSLSEMTLLLSEIREDDPNKWKTLTAKQFSELFHLFLSSMRLHEELENRFLMEALKELESDGYLNVTDIQRDHQSIDVLLDLLSSLAHMPEDFDSGSLRFTLSQLRWNLEQHMEHEEEQLFPLMRRVLPKRSMQELSKGARSLYAAH